MEPLGPEELQSRLHDLCHKEHPDDMDRSFRLAVLLITHELETLGYSLYDFKQIKINAKGARALKSPCVKCESQRCEEDIHEQG